MGPAIPRQDAAASLEAFSRQHLQRSLHVVNNREHNRCLVFFFHRPIQMPCRNKSDGRLGHAQMATDLQSTVEFYMAR